MKRIKTLALFMLLTFCGLSSYSQIVYTQPFFLDSINNKGEKFDNNCFLHIPSFDMLKESDTYKKVGLKETVILPSPKKGTYEVNTYVCYLKAQDFSKVTLNLYATDKVKIALNGESIKERLTTKDSLNGDSKVEAELKLEPGSYILSFTFLASNDNTIHQFRYEIEGDKVETSTSYLKYGLTLKEMLGGRNIYSTTISPNGDYSLVKYFDCDDKGKKTYGYNIISNKENEPKIVFTEEGNSSISWLSANTKLLGKKYDLYYTETKNEKNKLIAQDVFGAKTIIAENLPEGSEAILPNQDNNIIISQINTIDNSKDDLHRYLMPDDRIDGWRNRTNLSLYNLKTGASQPLTYGYHSTNLNDYNPTTNSILFSVSYDNITVRPFNKTSIYELNLNTLKIDTIINEDAFVSSAKYIPSSDKILVSGSGEAFNSIGSTLKKGVIPNVFHNMLFLFDTKTKEVECITKNFDPSVGNVNITDNGKLFFSAENKDSISVYNYDFLNKTIKKLELGLDIISSFDVSMNGNSIAYHGQRYNDYPKAFVINNIDKGLNAKLIYKAKDKNDLALGEMNVWNFKHSGTTIEGRYYLPSDFDATKKYPMIVYYYAGTSPTDRSFEMRYSAFLYTAQGYVVYVLNPSGTTGYGQEFAARHVNAWGEKTADEIIDGVKLFCKEHSFVDEKKIGCIGASYGGFMTQLLQTKTDIFACAISHAGISDITSYWGEGYWGYSYSGGATANSYPWNRRDIYIDRSPLFNANKIKTPILLLHGTSDTNVPIGESIQMYNALKILGKEVEFITIKGENHGIVDYEKRIKWNNTIYAWFAKYLKGQDSWWKELYPDTKL